MTIIPAGLRNAEEHFRNSKQPSSTRLMHFLFVGQKMSEPEHRNNGANVLRNHCNLCFPFQDNEWLKNTRIALQTHNKGFLLFCCFCRELVLIYFFHPFQALDTEADLSQGFFSFVLFVFFQILPSAATPYYARTVAHIPKS